MGELNWSDGQWQKVKDAVTEAFGKASVASAFLPLYGPLAGSAETVRNELLKENDPLKPQTVTLDTDHAAVNLKFVNLTVKVELSSEQVAEDGLSNALLAFRRAGNILAQEEDRIVFEGYLRSVARKNSPYVANKPGEQMGLADLPARRSQRFANFRGRGLEVVRQVIRAIQELENRYHTHPFACVLGNDLFLRAHEPAPSLALAADRITSLLKGGPLLRSGQIDTSTGIVVSLSGNVVDIVIATPPTVQCLQRTTDAKFLFRVYERFALRVRDQAEFPVAGFTSKAIVRAEEQQRLAEQAAAQALAVIQNLAP